MVVGKSAFRGGPVTMTGFGTRNHRLPFTGSTITSIFDIAIAHARMPGVELTVCLCLGQLSKNGSNPAPLKAADALGCNRNQWVMEVASRSTATSPFSSDASRSACRLLARIGPLCLVHGLLVRRCRGGPSSGEPGASLIDDKGEGEKSSIV